jgi:hypothetical protein
MKAAGRDGRVLVGDKYAARVRLIMPNGTIQTVAGGGPDVWDNGPAGKAHLTDLQYIAFSPDGSFYISDPSMGRIRRVMPHLSATPMMKLEI